MNEEALQQIVNLITKGKSTAILLGQHPSLDVLCGAAALSEIAKKNDQTVQVISSSTEVLPQPLFLSKPLVVRKSFGAPDQFTVKISTANAKPDELRYDVEADSVMIYLKSKEGQFKEEDVSVIAAMGKADTIITLGVSSFEQLGKLYTDSSAIFFDTPIVNIDNNPANEYFGTVNLVDVKASSVCEIIFDIATKLTELSSSELVATALLGGIIEQTQSFRDQKTTPATLSKAAQLITAGAKQQDIIQHLFKTKPFAVLQLWGRALARIVSVPTASLLYTSLTKADLEKTHAGPQSLVEVLRDLVDVVGSFSVVTMAVELPEGIKVFVAGLPHVQVSQLISKLGGAATLAEHLTGNFQFASAVIEGKTPAEIQEQLAAALSS